MSKAMLWIGRVLSGLVVLLMLFGIAYSFAKPAEVAEGMQKHGYLEHHVRPIVFAELACVVLYIIPQTAVLGAILLTGYLGGATATHVRVDEPFLTPVIVGIVAWLGLFFRDARVRALVPFRN